MKIVMYGNDSGSKFWRLVDPAKYLSKNGIEAYVSEEGINEYEANWADIIVVQSCTDKNGIAYLYQMQQEKGLKIVVESDDYFDLNDDSPFKEEHNLHDAKFVITQTMKIADLITTTTDYLAKKLSKFNKNVEVLPNFMDLERWDLKKLKNNDGTIRIGYLGSITHLEDVKMISEPVKRISKEFPEVRLILMGDPRLAEFFEGVPMEVMNGVPFEAYPAKLHSLRLDIGLAPLRDTEFNKCKSNIKWQEYSVAKVPGIFSPTVYESSSFHITFDGNVGMIAENEEQWYRCLKNYIICKPLRKDIASRAYSFITGTSKGGYSLENHITRWISAYNKLTQQVV